MKKLKNNIKVIIAFILGGIMFGGGIYAATLFSSDQVLYKDSNTVKGALDDLYNITKRYTNITYGIILRGAKSNNYSRAGVELSFINASSNMNYNSVFNYFKLHDLTMTGNDQVNMADCYVEGYYIPTHEFKRLTLNKQYNANDYSAVELYCKSINESWSSAYVLVDFYN